MSSTAAAANTSKTPSRTYSKRASDSSSFFSPKTYAKLTREGSSEADLEGKENSSQEIPTATITAKNSPNSDNELGSSVGNGDCIFYWYLIFIYTLGRQPTISRGNSKRNNSLGGSPDGGDDYNFDLAGDKKLPSSQVKFFNLIFNFH